MTDDIKGLLIHELVRKKIICKVLCNQSNKIQEKIVLIYAKDFSQGFIKGQWKKNLSWSHKILTGKKDLAK